LRYILSDHPSQPLGTGLGSTTVSATGAGVYHSELRYKPWGETRYSDGTTPTQRHFTGQINESQLGLYFFNARWYDPASGRFTSADSLVPNMGNPQAWDRYAFVYNNPVKFTDPSGHHICDEEGNCWDQGRPTRGYRTRPPRMFLVPPVVPNAPTGGDPATPVNVGLEWLTGSGPRHHEFREGDPFTELLQTHEHLELVRSIIASKISAGNFQPGSMPYDLSGIEGVPKYIKDYSTLATGGQTGNLAVTYLGSYQLDYYVVSLDIAKGTAKVLIHIQNSSTLGSVTRPPVIGYLPIWQNTVESLVNTISSIGPMSKVTQDFWWTETIRYRED
jgi:RHS repeat-associated protein